MSTKIISPLIVCGLLLAACGTPAPTLDFPTAGPTFTPAPIQATLAPTAAPQSPTHTPTIPPPPATPLILYSTADGEIPIDVSFMRPRGLGLANPLGGVAIALNPLANEQDYFVGLPFAWSPDGARIVFVSTREGKADLYVMNADGTNVNRITSNGENASPAWSPDGSKIAYVSTRGGEANIYIISPAGGDAPCLTCDLPGSEKDPAWSPDSGWLAFAVAGGPESIYILSVETKEARAISPSELKSSFPSFSPDGQWVVFVCESTICTRDRAGNVVGSFPSSGTSDQPRISPAGRQIAFISDRDGNFDLYVVNADGSDLLRLTTSSYSEMHPAWSADGQWIAFASAVAFQEGYTNYDIFIVRPDGSDLKQLTNSPGNDL